MLKRIPLKWKFWDFWVLRSKFVKFFMSIFKRQVDSSPNFVSLFNFIKDYCSVLCFSSDNTYFAQKEHIKMKFFETFNCPGQNSSNSSCKFWNDKSILLHILHPSLPVDFKLILFLHWIKGSHQNPNFETFNCSGENLHIPHVTFQTTSFLKFCITFQCHER